MVWRQLVARRVRSVALVACIAVAVTAFTVLTGAAETSRLQASSVVAANARGAYDILVRPKGSVLAQESSQGLVRSDYLSGMYGGISLGQLTTIRAVPGVQVAAPVQVVGTMLLPVSVPVDLPGASYEAGPQLFRLRVTRETDRGLTTYPGVQTQYVYLTPNRLQPWKDPDPQHGDGVYADTDWGAVEVMPDGSRPVACPRVRFGVAVDVLSPTIQSSFACWSKVNGYLDGFPGPAAATAPPSAVKGQVSWTVPVMVAAIDPAAEDELVGLGRATVAGRALRPSDTTVPDPTSAGSMARVNVPLVMASSTTSTDTAQVVIERVSGDAAALMHAGASKPGRLGALATVPGTPVGRVTVTAQQAYDAVRAVPASDRRRWIWRYYTTDPVTFTATRAPGGETPQSGSSTPAPRAGGAAAGLTPQPVTPGTLLGLSGKGMSDDAEKVPPPVDGKDTWFRAVTVHEWARQRSLPAATLSSVGTFDPAKIDLGPLLSRMPTGYEAPPVTGGDDASKAALGGRSLAPNDNLGGYLQATPVAFTTLAAAATLTDPVMFPPSEVEKMRPGYVDRHERPISSIRVRVAGVKGVDALSREKVRAVAERISGLGLQVDITVGSSPAPTLTSLPAGEHGRPALVLDEAWTKKGVAVTVVNQVDRKSLLLFTLILLVCAMSVLNAASAAVRSRRTELGVLACLGWSPGRLFAMIIAELSVVGLIAGVVGAVVAVPLAWAAGVGLSWQRGLLAVPAAMLLAALAGVVPAWRASRADPGAAVRPPVLAAGSTRPASSVRAMGVRNLARNPGRSALAAAALAIGVAALTIMTAITVAFSGAVTGSLLGDAVTLSVRAVDIVAVVAIIALGVFSVADVLFVGIKERAAELATLRAIGWDEPTLARLVGWEGAGIGLSGSLAGAGIGLATAWYLAGSITPTLAGIAAAAIVVGTLLAVASTIIPSRALAGMPTATTLAEE